MIGAPHSVSARCACVCLHSTFRCIKYREPKKNRASKQRTTVSGSQASKVICLVSLENECKSIISNHGTDVGTKQPYCTPSQVREVCVFDSHLYLKSIIIDTFAYVCARMWTNKLKRVNSMRWSILSNISITYNAAHSFFFLFECV